MEMNSTLKTIIKAGQNGKNSREIKEAEIAGLKQTRGLIVKEMVNRIMSTDSLPTETDELINFLQNDNNFRSRINLFKLYKTKRQFQNAQACIESMRIEIQIFGLDRMTEIENYLDIQEILLNIDNGSLSMEDAVSQNMEFLQNLANTENVAGEITAQVLLEQAGVDTVLEVIRLPEPIVQPKNQTFDDSDNIFQDVDEIVNVYPNPASDNIYIEYAFMNKDKNRFIRIYNTNGQLVDQIRLEQAIGLFNYTNDLPAGNYIIKVGKNHSQQITIL